MLCSQASAPVWTSQTWEAKLNPAGSGAPEARPKNNRRSFLTISRSTFGNLLGLSPARLAAAEAVQGGSARLPLPGRRAHQRPSVPPPSFNPNSPEGRSSKSKDAANYQPLINPGVYK